ncbi:MAG: hypothetical protein ABWY64_13305 [Tardiphaga sp.]
MNKAPTENQRMQEVPDNPLAIDLQDLPSDWLTPAGKQRAKPHPKAEQKQAERTAQLAEKQRMALHKSKQQQAERIARDRARAAKAQGLI